MPSNKTPVEIELKLKLAPEHRVMLADHPMFKPHPAAKTETRHLVTTYYDTAERDIAMQGLTLRVRRKGDTLVQTLKGRGNGLLASTRDEWEWPIEQDTPDLSQLAGTPHQDLLTEEQATRLQPLFVSEVTRTTHIVKFGDGTIEVAFDEGWIVAGDRREAIAELELEHIEGPPCCLYDLAQHLHKSVPFHLAQETKAARGFRVKSGHGPGPTKAVIPNLPGDVTIDTAIKILLGSLVTQLVANHEALNGVRELDALRQMSVGLQQIRSLLELMDDHIDPSEQLTFFTALDGIIRTVERAHDWDVFVDRNLAELTGSGLIFPKWARIRKIAEQQRHQAWTTLRAEVESQKFTALLLALAVHAERSGEQDDGKIALALLAPDLLDRLWQKALEPMKRAEDHDAQRFYALQHAVGNFRYGLEILLPRLYPGTPSSNSGIKLARILEEIGDCATADALSAELVSIPEDLLLDAPAKLLRWNGERRRLAFAAFDTAWADFESTPPFWR